MRAIILVGGEGTRMRPLTWRTPKALVPVLGVPLLDQLLLHLRRHGIERATLAMTQRNTHSAEAIREAYEDGARLGMAVDYAYEDTPLGSGGAIAGIAGGWDETFVVVNGDVITDLDVTAMVEHHRARQAVLSISLHEVEDPSPFGVVDLAEDGRIRRFVEKPPRAEAPSRLINAGTWIFEPHLVGMLDAQAFNRVEDTLFPTLCAQGEAVFGFHRPAYWSDVGTPEALRRVNLDMARGLVASPATPPVTGGVYVDPTASIEDGAHIEAPAVIGAGSRVAAGARVCASVLWAGVHIEEGAIIEDSVLASGVHVGAGATVRASVVAHGAIVDAGASLDGVSVEPADVAAIAEEARLG